MSSGYAGLGTGSDSGTEPPTSASPQSVSDTAPSSSFGPSMATPAYSAQTDPPGTSIAGASDYRVILPAASQPYGTVAPSFSYPAMCQQQSQSGFPAPVSSASWEMNSLVTPPVSGASSNGSCYSYLAPFPLPDASHGP